MAMCSRRSNALSEINLRIHTAEFSKNNACLQNSSNLEEPEPVTRAEILGSMDIDMDSLSDGDFSPQDVDLEVRRKASLDALKLYSGSFASLCTPMDRFIAGRPTTETSSWLARHPSTDSAVGLEEYWETLDAFTFASETSEDEDEDVEVEEIINVRPSSDTLPVWIYVESRNVEWRDEEYRDEESRDEESRDAESRHVKSRRDGKEHGEPHDRRKLRSKKRNTLQAAKWETRP